MTKARGDIMKYHELTAHGYKWRWYAAHGKWHLDKQDNKPWAYVGRFSSVGNVTRYIEWIGDEHEQQKR